jgi:transposase
MNVDLDPREVRRLYWKDGWTIAELAEKYGLSVPTMYRRMDKLGIERRDPKPRPGHGSQSRMDPEERAEVLSRIIDNGEAQVEVLKDWNDAHPDRSITKQALSGMVARARAKKTRKN